LRGYPDYPAVPKAMLSRYAKRNLRVSRVQIPPDLIKGQPMVWKLPQKQLDLEAQK
jgi:hypothetical protein